MPDRSLLRIEATCGDNALDVVRAVRYRVLREPLGMPYESTAFAGDALENTLHLIGHTERGPAGCLTLLLPVGHPLRESRIWTGETNRGETDCRVRFTCDAVPQAAAVNETASTPLVSVQLRGMAVLPEHQGQGLGGQLLRCVYGWAYANSWSLWCNARDAAVPFYRKYGWTLHGDAFEIPVIGRHFIMRWEPLV